jgi:hypothetical protein
MIVSALHWRRITRFWRKPMGAFSIISFTLAFMASGILIGGLYGKLSLSREAWTVVSILTYTLLAVSLVIDRVRKKKEN